MQKSFCLGLVSRQMSIEQVMVLENDRGRQEDNYCLGLVSRQMSSCKGYGMIEVGRR